jgi:hypothetical protein
MSDAPTDRPVSWEIPAELPKEVGGYPVRYFIENGLYVAVVEGLPGGSTDVERPEELADAVRDLVLTLKNAFSSRLMEGMPPPVHIDSTQFTKPPD